MRAKLIVIYFFHIIENEKFQIPNAYKYSFEITELQMFPAASHTLNNKKSFSTLSLQSRNRYTYAFYKLNISCAILVLL